MRVREFLRALPCWPVFVDRDCYNGLRAGKKASGGESYSVVIDRYAELANNSLTHRHRRREVKKAVARGSNINPNSLKVTGK